MNSRIFASAAITLLIWMALGGILGATAADDAPPVPRTFDRGVYQIGDEAIYEVVRTKSIDGGRPETERYRVVFSWEEATTALDNDGVRHDVNTMRVTTNGQTHFGTTRSDPSVQTSLLYSIPDAGQPIQTVTYETGTSSAGSIIAPAERVDTKSAADLFKPMFPCGVVPHWPQEFDPTQAVLTVDYCHEMINSLERTLRATAVDELPAGLALRLEGGGDGFFHPNLETTWWLAPGIPYPLAIEWNEGKNRSNLNTQTGERREFHQTEEVRLELVHFQSGTRPLLASSQANPEVDTDWDEAPWHPWGPSEADVDHPFPLSQAFQMAQTDPESPLSEAMRGDGANVVYAKFESRSEGPQTRLVWSLILANEHTIEHVVISQTTAPPSYELTRMLPMDLPGSETRYEYLEEAILWFASIPLGDIPESGPTARSLIEVWRAYADPDIVDGTLDGWGFHIVCIHNHNTGDPCSGISLSPWGGASWQERTRDTEHMLIDEERTRSSMLSKSFGRIKLAESDTQFVPRDLVIAPSQPPANRADIAPIWQPDWVWPATVAIAGAGFIAFMVGALHYFGPVLRVGFIGLFSRVRQDQVLDHPVRRELMDIVEQEPGIHFQELRRRSGNGIGNVRHHLDRLQATGHIVTVSAGGHRCYFPKGRIDRAVAGALPFLRTDAARRVLRHVVQRPGITSQGVAHAVGLSPSTASHHLHRLLEAGLVTQETAGRSRLWVPSATAARVLET